MGRRFLFRIVIAASRYRQLDGARQPSAKNGPGQRAAPATWNGRDTPFGQMFAERQRGYDLRANWRRWACVGIIAIRRRNRCCSGRRVWSSARSRLVRPAAGPRATCWRHGALQAARDRRAGSRATSASPPASASSMSRGSDATQRRRSAPNMENGGSARNLKLGRLAGGNRKPEANLTIIADWTTCW